MNWTCVLGLGELLANDACELNCTVLAVSWQFVRELKFSSNLKFQHQFATAQKLGLQPVLRSVNVGVWLRKLMSLAISLSIYGRSISGNLFVRSEDYELNSTHFIRNVKFEFILVKFILLLNCRLLSFPFLYDIKCFAVGNLRMA